MSHAQQRMPTRDANRTASRPRDGRQQRELALPQPPRQRLIGYSGSRTEAKQNVSDGERMVSVAAGAILAFLGLGRRDVTGLLIAGVGGALAWRGATGQCAAYEALGVDTASGDGRSRKSRNADLGVHVSASY